MMPRPAHPTDIAPRDRPVRIAVLLVQSDTAEAVKVAGPVRTAVRAAFAQNDAHQEWQKSNGSTTVRWWIDRDDVLSPNVKRA